MQTIVHLIQNYYRDTNYYIVTPYDAQQAAIEHVVKSASLPWEAIYNLDSFQGTDMLCHFCTMFKH